MDTIGNFLFRNNGGFVAQGYIMYIDPNGNTGTTDGYGNIPIGQQEWCNPGDKGVPDGSFVQLAIDIVLGNNRTTGTYYLYSSTSNQYAEYDITGTTFNSSVHFDGIKTK